MKTLELQKNFFFHVKLYWKSIIRPPKTKCKRKTSMELMIRLMIRLELVKQVESSSRKMKGGRESSIMWNNLIESRLFIRLNNKQPKTFFSFCMKYIYLTCFPKFYILNNCRLKFLFKGSISFYSDLINLI